MTVRHHGDNITVTCQFCGSILSTGRPQIAKIVEAVSAATGYTPEEIKGKGRHQDIARIRHFTVAMCRRYTNASMPQIGRVLNRDHTTILNSVKAFERISTPQDLADMEAIAKAAGVVTE